VDLPKKKWSSILLDPQITQIHSEQLTTRGTRRTSVQITLGCRWRRRCIRNPSLVVSGELRRSGPAPHPARLPFLFQDALQIREERREVLRDCIPDLIQV
jgi:hypothetical protein